MMAVRPEKIEIAPQALPPGTVNAVAGQVTEIAYLGSVSTYRVRLDSGKMVVSTQTNRHHYGGAAIGRGARVISLPVEASILLAMSARRENGGPVRARRGCSGAAQ